MGTAHSTIAKVERMDCKYTASVASDCITNRTVNVYEKVPKTETKQKKLNQITSTTKRTNQDLTKRLVNITARIGHECVNIKKPTPNTTSGAQHEKPKSSMLKVGSLNKNGKISKSITFSPALRVEEQNQKLN